MTSDLHSQANSGTGGTRGPGGGTGSRARVFIAVGAVVLGILIALGGSAAIVANRRQAPNESFEAMVDPNLPLVVGDTVSLHVGSTSCETNVLGTLPDGRVVIRGCSGVGADTVTRIVLRVGRYPASGPAPDPGDIVLVPGRAGWTRAVIVSLESNNRVRIRPVPGAANAPTIDPAEQSVDRTVLLAVQRPRRQSY
jgi:hypothetical protein